MIKILFTKSNKIGSYLIRKVLKEPVSHCAILTEDTVVHSTITKGIVAEPLKDFLKCNQILYVVDLPGQDFKMTKGSYDYGALSYLVIKYLLEMIHIKLPKKNLWQATGMYLCTEYITEVIDMKEHSLITPYKLYKRLSAKG